MSSQAKSKRHALVFDIETFGDVTQLNRDAIAALADKKERTAEDYAGLCPPLARVACISWLDLSSQQLIAAFDATLGMGESGPEQITVPAAIEGTPERDCVLRGCDGEAALLAEFGAAVEAHMRTPTGSLVTYSGRNFDLPVLIHRSLRHGVEPGLKPLVRSARENRFAPLLHVDMLDVATFNGAGSRFPLAAYAIGHGARSPKTEMDGSMVGEAIRAGQVREVARYCAADVVATAFLYERLESIIAFGGDRGR